MQSGFAGALNAWVNVGFTTLQKTMDEQGAKIDATQSAGTQSRKELAQRTKAFHKQPSDEKLNEIKPLLKLYQAEIDALTTRAKYAESCFMHVYLVISEAPDPVPVLEIAVQKGEKGAKVDQLRQKNLELANKVSALESQAKLNAQTEKNLAERESFYQGREKELERENEDLAASLKVAEARVLAAEGSADPDESALKLAESHAVARQLERTLAKLARYEQRCRELEQAQAPGAGALNSSEIEQAQRENAELLRQADSLRLELDSAQSATKAQLETVNARTAALESQLASANAALAAQQDYNEVCAELKVLRSLEFGDAAPDAAGDGLVALLESKNERLSASLATLRSEQAQAQSGHDALVKRADDAEQQVQHLKSLVSRLENDLSTLNQHDDTFSTASGWTAIPKQTVASSIAGQRAPAPAPAPDASLLAIVTQQRDRFKQKSQGLEEDLHHATQAITSLRKELDSARAENVAVSDFLPRGLRRGGVYEEGKSALEQSKSYEAHRVAMGGSVVDRVIFELFEMALLRRGVRYAAAVYLVGVHVLLVVLFI